MNPDAQSFLQHFQDVSALAQRLAAFDVAVYEHNYLTLVFGSWMIVAGRRKQRFRFCWDGRDGVLTVEKAEFSDAGQKPKWEAVKSQSIPVGRYQEVTEATEKILKEEFAA